MSRRRTAGRAGRSSDLRVLFLMWRDTSHPDGGGSEVFVEEIAARLAADGHAVTVLCADHGAAERDELRAGVRFRRRGSRLGVYLHGLAFLLRHGREYDVVVDVQNGLPFFSPLVRRRPIVVLLHHVHREQWHIIYPGWRGRVGWWIESKLSVWLYRRRPYVTVSHASRQDMARLGIPTTQVTLVHNGIDVPHPDLAQARSSRPTVCVLGRLVPHKQVEHVFAAAAVLRRDFPTLQVDVVGDGWWRDPLEQSARSYGVADLVTFHGHVSDDERGNLLDRAWVLVAPSVKEGWGIAIMEAAARGVPAIAYRTAGGVTEAIQDLETGRLVNDTDDVIKVTAELLGDEDLRSRYGRAARDRAAAFDWAISARLFGAVLREAVGRD